MNLINDKGRLLYVIAFFIWLNKELAILIKTSKKVYFMNEEDLF